MSTVLSNGVIVPDVGSTNWASDLETNWTLLNALIGAVGANVRLDRPNIWTAAQTFSEGIYGDLDGTAAMAVNDANGNEIATTYALKTSVTSLQTAVTDLQTAVASKAADNAVVHLAGAETISGDKTFTGAVVTHNITPETTGTYSLGSSSYQWASVYAQSYYYGSTQWGLDQRNVWTADNIVAKDTSPTIWLKITNLTRGTPPSGTVTADFGVRAANENLISQLATQITTNGNTYVYSRANDGTRDQRVGIFLDATNDTVNYRTASNGVVNLGDSSHKWKTLNGINPGALGMPSTGASRVDIASIITDLTGADINFLPPVPGWLCLRIDGAVGNMLYAQQSSYGIINRVNGDGGDYIYLIFPFQANINVLLKVKGTSGLIARYYPCLGNV